MPWKPRKPCSDPRCGRLTNGRFCDRHQAAHEARQTQRRAEVDAQRPTAAARGYDGKWREARAGFLAKHPWCECTDCVRTGRQRPATVVDHIRPHRGDRALFWDRSNWRAMSAECHSRKTASEDGGFGNPSAHARGAQLRAAAVRARR